MTTETTAPGEAGAATDAAAPTPAAAGQAPAAPAASPESLLTPPAAAADAPPAADPPAAGDDWLPEKFRVTREDGTLDEAASARKLAESYKALEAHKGPLPSAPASPDDYKIEPPEGVEADAFAQWMADPLFKAFAADAHKHGMTNEQLQFVTAKYLTVAPALVAENAAMSVEDARAELGKLWTTEQAMQQGLASVHRAIGAFGAEGAEVAGSRDRLLEKYGTDPDFIAFAAAVAKELPEDRPASGATPGAYAMDPESLARNPAYWDPTHQDHERAKAQVAEAHARKFGTGKR